MWRFLFVCVCVYSRACLLYVEYIAQKSAIFCDGIIFMLASHISFLTFAPCCRRHSSMYIVFYVATTDIYRFICFCFFALPLPPPLYLCLRRSLISIYLFILPFFRVVFILSNWLWFQLFSIVVTVSFNLLPIVFYLLQRNIRYRYWFTASWHRSMPTAGRCCTATEHICWNW